MAAGSGGALLRDERKALQRANSLRSTVSLTIFQLSEWQTVRRRSMVRRSDGAAARGHVCCSSECRLLALSDRLAGRFHGRFGAKSGHRRVPHLSDPPPRMKMALWVGGRLSTALSLVRDNGCWRVRITWPSGITKYFGKFDSEREAVDWMDSHRWLGADHFDKSEIRRKSGPRVRHRDRT